MAITTELECPTIDEIIKELEKIKAEHGNLPTSFITIYFTIFSGGTHRGKRLDIFTQ